MVRQLFSVIVVGMLLVPPIASRAEDLPANDLLELISLESRVGEVDIPQNHDTEKYLPYFEASVDDVVKVAVLACYWEVYCIQRHRAIRTRIGAAEGFLLGGAGTRPAGVAADQEFDFEAHDTEFKARMVGPLQLALKHGTLAAFEGKSFLKRAQQGYDLGFKQGIANNMTSSANEYLITAEMAELQDAMWNAAGRVARAGAKSSSLDPNSVAVKLRIERKRGFTVVVHNGSADDLHHLTLVANGTKTPVKGISPNGDRLLGGLTAALSGEEDPDEIRKSGDQLAESVAAHQKVLNRPTRIFVHIPHLPAGEEWSIVFARSSMEMARIESTSFWLWTKEGSFEAQPLGGFDEVREEMRKNAANNPGPPNRRGPQTGSSLLPLFGGASSGGASREGTERPAPSLNNLSIASEPQRLLLMANNFAKVNLIDASAQFRQIVARYPKSDEAVEAKQWLDSYPQQLLELAEQATDNQSGHTQAIRLYKEVLGSKPDSAEQRAAKKGLEDRAAKLLAAAAEMDESGNKVGAARIYNQLIQDLPTSREANAARARLRKAAAAKKK